MKTAKKLPRARTSNNPQLLVLCGTDFSPSAARAADVAAAMARRLRVPIELAHATQIPQTPQPTDLLHTEADRLRRQGVTVRESLLDGNADEELVKRAQPAICQLVVLGGLGKRGAARWLLGSVSERTAERAPAPTLVVRNAPPLEAWLRGDRPLKVFVSFNFTATSESALKWVKHLTNMGSCEIIVGFVARPPEERARLGGTGPVPLVDNPSEVQAILERDIRARAKDILGSEPFRIRVEADWGRPDIRLSDMAREERAEPMVIGSHQYQGFERMWHASVSRGVLHSASTNVIVVPSPWQTSQPLQLAPPVRQVLVATDFPDAAAHAISRAYSVAPRDGVVHLLHVIHPHALPGGVYLEGSRDRQFENAHAKLVEMRTRELRALVPAQAEAREIKSAIMVAEHTDPATGIVQAAERLDADVICLGMHGQTGRIESLLGSVTRDVMTKTGRPVLVVRAPRS